MEKLKIFCSDNEFRPAFNHLHQHGKYVYATDSYCLALKEGTIEVDPSKAKISGSVDELIEEWLSAEHELILELNKAYYEKRLLELPQVDLYDDCEECHGAGTITCNCCDNDSDCEECDGTGNGKKIGIGPTRHSTIEVAEGRYLNPRFLTKTFTMSEHINIYVPLDDSKGMCRVEAGEYIIFIMQIKGAYENNLKL